MNVKILTLSTVPTDLAKAWLQHLRDFDVAHPGCRFEIVADAPDVPMKDIIEMLRLDPALDFQTILERKAKP